MRKKVIAFLTLLALLVSTMPMGLLSVSAASGGAVTSTPAVRSSGTADGTFSLTADSRLFLVSDTDPTGTTLATYVQTAASVLAAKGIPSSTPLDIVYGKESGAQAGDIVIRLDSSATGHSEGYVLNISTDRITITADDAAGVFYALITLTQTCASGTSLACASVTDWPDVRERSVYLDCGRIYFSPATIKALIHTLAWNKMNTLYLDFSNNNATRFFLDEMDVTVGGTTYDITKAKPSEYLTQSDMDGIIAEADKYGVQIIPTFNSPGHIGGIKSINSSFFKSASASDYDSATGKVALNILDSTAYSFGQEVVKLYVDYFASRGCTSFNIAADEVTDAISGLNSSNSTFVSYVNDLNTYIKSKGMTTRMFNDGFKNLSSAISKDIVVLYWTTEAVSAQEFIDAGYSLANFNYQAGLYYAYCSGISSAYVWNQDVDKLYANWNPGVTGCKVYSWGTSSYSYTPQEWVSDYSNEDKFLGAAFAIWTDYAFNKNKNGATIFAENYKNMMQKIYTVGERCWSTVCTDSYSTWSGKLKAAPGGLTLSGSVDSTSLPAAGSISQAVGYDYEIGEFTVTATRRTMTGITLTWTAPQADKAVTYTVQKTLSGATTTLAENITDLFLEDDEAAEDALYTVTASMVEDGKELAQPVTASVTSTGGGLPAFTEGSVATVSVGGEVTYVLDTDGIEDGTYVMVIYNTNNESSSNYYAVSTTAKTSSPYGLATTQVTNYVDNSAGTVDISSLDSENYLWNVTASNGTYTISAANGEGSLSINGQNNVSLTGSNTALALTTGSRTNAYYVNASGSNGYRLDMYSDRSGYQPSNGQCLLSAWDTSGSQNHNNVYFYRQTGGGSEAYQADHASLDSLIAFAETIDTSLYANWESLEMDSLIANAKAAASVAETSDLAEAQTQQQAINQAGQALYEALTKLGTEIVSYGTVIVKYVDDLGQTLKADVQMKGREGTAYTVVPEALEGYLTPESVSGTYGKDISETITLVYTLHTDKTALKAELDSLVDQGDYTDESYAAYTEAVAAGQTIYDKDRALQSEVDQALQAIVTAKAGLKSAVEVVTPKTMTGSSNLSFYSTYSASLALDGDTSTYAWLASAQSSGDWYKVSFDDVYTISEVTVTSSYASDYIRAANLQVSVNGSSWTTVGTYSGSGTKTISLEGYVDAKYVRLQLTSSSSNWWVLNEISFTFGPASQYAGQTQTSGFSLDSDGAINSGSEYVIKSSASDYALAVSGTSLTAVAVSPEDDVISMDDDYAVWIITKSGSGYTLQNKGSGLYLKLSSSSYGGWSWGGSSSASLSLSSSATTFTASTGSTYSFYTTSSRRTYYVAMNGSTPTASSSSRQATTTFKLYLSQG